ncbi:MAG: hypothetical protein ACYTXY_04175 [Nostoc sp.]
MSSEGSGNDALYETLHSVQEALLPGDRGLINIIKFCNGDDLE